MVYQNIYLECSNTLGVSCSTSPVSANYLPVGYTPQGYLLLEPIPSSLSPDYYSIFLLLLPDFICFFLFLSFIVLFLRVSYV
jgi:hypothetical protein